MRTIGGEARARMIANILTGCAIVLFAVVLYRIDDIMNGVSQLMSILSPLIVGLFIALMMRPPIRFIEQLLSRLSRGGKPTRTQMKLYRALSLVIMYAVLFTLVVGFLVIVVPQFVYSAQSLTGAITGVVTEHRADIEWFLREFNITDITGQSSQNMLLQWEDIMHTGMDYLGKLLLSLLNMSYNIWGVSVNLFMSVIISIYMLFGREKFLAQGKKLCCAFLKPEQVCVLTYWTGRIHQIFTGFISGKLIETVVVGVACYIGMLVFRMDYALLISVIVARDQHHPVHRRVPGRGHRRRDPSDGEPRQRAVVFGVHRGAAAAGRQRVRPQDFGGFAGHLLLLGDSGDHAGRRAVWRDRHDRVHPDLRGALRDDERTGAQPAEKARHAPRHRGLRRPRAARGHLPHVGSA
jgi:predicted PurR-regulated permease PerM